ncbi:MAG: TolC family protein [Ignavibacteriae bacterium]|nr:TolC family protein [Ignavibacteriota bacterium]
MKYFFVISLLFFCSVFASSQTDTIVIPESNFLDLESIIIEALVSNQEIQSMQYDWDMIIAKVPQSGTLPNPMLEYMHDEFPGIRFGEQMFSRIKLSQMFDYPTKLSTERTIAEIQAEHSHHGHLEKINSIIANVKSVYFELWYVQQAIFLMNENIRLMNQFLSIAQTKYSVGNATLQEVLKSQVEITKMQNQLIDLRAKELSMKAMLMAFLNRQQEDTLGYAFISEIVAFDTTLDSLEQYALSNRPMLIHDSLMISENQKMLKMAKLEYYPDFNVSLEKVYSPMTQFDGWSISAGITLPFVPWTITRTDSKIEEANLGIKKAEAGYLSSKNMVISSVRDLYYRISSGRRQINNYATTIIPQAEQSLQASLTSYQSSQTDFLMLIDAFRTLTDLRMEYFMLRMQFEQNVAELERVIGKSYYTDSQLTQGNGQ